MITVIAEASDSHLDDLRLREHHEIEVDREQVEEYAADEGVRHPVSPLAEEVDDETDDTDPKGIRQHDIAEGHNADNDLLGGLVNDDEKYSRGEKARSSIMPEHSISTSSVCPLCGEYT